MVVVLLTVVVVESGGVACSESMRSTELCVLMRNRVLWLHVNSSILDLMTEPHPLMHRNAWLCSVLLLLL